MRVGFSFFMCKRTKLRGSPKALITKDNKETFYPAWLMPQGIVKSLEILAIEMGDRGSKSVILGISLCAITILGITVKEQRVDGSFIILSIMIRCTLAAGKAGSWKKSSNSRLKLSQ